MNARNARIYPLGFRSTIIPAKGTMRIAVDLKANFTSEWLVIPSPIGKFFLIEHVFVHGEDILISGKKHPGTDFSEFVDRIADGKVKLKVKEGHVMNGKEISIQVTNISDQDRDFTACLFGTSSQLSI